jgi:hypothetical protein
VGRAQVRPQDSGETGGTARLKQDEAPNVGAGGAAIYKPPRFVQHVGTAIDRNSAMPMRKIETWVLEKLARYCEDPRYARVADYAPGEKIFSVGEPGDYMAILISGEVEIRIGDKKLTSVEFGSIFGEMGLIDGAPRSADAVAVTSCRVARVREGQFIAMLEETPHFALSLMRVLTDRLRNASST